MVQHKAEALPIFLAYRYVSVEGIRIPLIQVASSVVQALHDDSALDAVQPMHNGWCIYLCTIADRAKLVNSGLTLAGQYIQLHSEQRETRKPMVKLIFKDLFPYMQFLTLRSWMLSRRFVSLLLRLAIATCGSMGD